MEIFVGFYMRRWASPCLSLRGETKTPDMGFFSDLQASAGFQIFCFCQKAYRFSGHAEFGAKQAREGAFPVESERKADRMLKGPIRKPVHVVGLASQFLTQTDRVVGCATYC
jgi:hypothetical protein